MPLYTDGVITVDDFAVNDIANYTHVGPGVLGDFTIPGDGLLHGGGNNGSAIYRNDVVADAFKFRITLDPANLDAALFMLLRRESDGAWFIMNNPHTNDWHFYTSADNGGSFTDMGTLASANRLAIRSFEIEHTNGNLIKRTFDGAGNIIDESSSAAPAGWGAGVTMRPGVRINVPPGATIDGLSFNALVIVTHGRTPRRGARTKAIRKTIMRVAKAARLRPTVGQIWPRGSRGR